MIDTSMSQRWDDTGQVFYIDGWGYGLSPNLRTICIGKEEDIIKQYPVGKLTSKKRRYIIRRK